MAIPIVKLYDNAVDITLNIVPHGSYDAAHPYVTGDSVSYLGSSYVALQSTTGNLPTNVTYWQLLSAKGDTGSVGETGATGATGATGSQGIQGLGSNIRTFTWVINTPATGGIPGPRLKEAHTVTRIDSYVTGVNAGSPATSPTMTFNIEERTTIGSAGSNLLSSDQVANNTGATTTSFADSALAADHWLWIDISAVSGTPGKLVITLSATTP